ncbi:Sister-chromatid cohesion protein 3 [Capsicum chinense]|uniref:Cohesin subunit SA-3 n=1 Tax=Capsicum annuum TaxID=4072 RepID=A0A1U8EJ31_CAPAN|nr:sister-chromatid cohesion protein 3 isoform X1 [Capsicum annuum]PHT68476.1 Sister-chromatid cohesion protein 3 [Capsicum annuum]PHU03082.1 Sister-chromatid cohesion protein 3 [Capsicum chinense]
MEEEPVASETASRRMKRTRAQTRVNEEQLHGSVNEEEREESSDDFEDSRARAKRSKVLRGTSSVAARNAHQSLIDVVKGDRRQIPLVVKHWVEHYEKDPKAAMAGLLSMMFEACGTKYHIEENFLDQTDVDDVVVALVNMAKRGEVEDYQTSKKKDFKNFKDNLIYFWDTLVAECENGPLFDKVLFDKCMDYVIALSCTPPRVYRQVASLMGLQLVTSFIHVAKVLGSQREITQRQLNAEKKKKVDGPRVESLNKRLSMTHEKITIIEEMMRKIFTGLFMHRYRDVEPDIRMTCIQSLGVWILSYPSLFLQDLYLKYLGWTLNDKSDGVRKASVVALQNLYEVDDNVPSLGLFTERFYKRMIELADDVDISVAVCAIGLVKQLIRHQLVPEEELSSLYDLLIDDPPEIRRAIGALVYDNLIAQRLNSSQSSSGDNTDSSEVHLSRLLRILGEFSKDEILSMYVIDDVWEYMDAMRDWKRILYMLLEEEPSAELSDVDAANLIRLLSASIRKAVGEKIVPASDNRKQYYTKAQREMFESSKRDITVVMMRNYPQLLRKFMSDKAKIPCLLEIIVHVNLELYSLKRQDQTFKSAVLLMKEAFFKHGEKEALRSCVKALNFCATESRGELQDFALNKLKAIEEELIIKLKSAIKEVADGDDEYSLLVNLKRLYELQLSRQISIESLLKDFAETLKNFRSIDDEVIGFLLLNMHLHVCWCLHSILNSGIVLQQSISSLISKRSTLFELLESFLTTEPPKGFRASQLACRVCVIFSEQWCLFSKATFASTELEALGYTPGESILRKFWKLGECQLHIPDETEDEDFNREYIEETNRDAVIIAVGKLVAVDAVPKEYLAPEIVSHLAMHGTNVSEVIKHLLTVLRNKGADVALLFLEALKRAHERYLVALFSDDDESARKTLQECEDLASGLAKTFGKAARNKCRSDVLNIVTGGIHYAFTDAPKHLSFLDGAVLHFISKLSPPDIMDILKDVEKRTENVNTDEDPSGWRPYHIFVDTVHEKYSKGEGLQDDKEGTVGRRRGRPPKKQNLQGKKLFDQHNSSEDEESISGSDQEADEEKQEDEVVPLIHSMKSSSKLRSLKISRES